MVIAASTPSTQLSTCSLNNETKTTTVSPQVRLAQ
ncbi:hypothetical protein SAMN05216506_11515 [Saccharopolyspora kobensis]|uniref:Uncharacterized protein n=1 Tax=Saccharopolyspora kobensis TaxID=146035 RepID=A0ABY1E5A4_9PSEU|nr:hypothetical protein SAMN05216506_11515 [Saccharopolyspora kobensis]